MKDTKMIRVVSRGYVTTSRGRVISPIMSPYRESISRIWSMMTSDRADVEEKLPDGTFLKLTPQNFDKDNFASKEKKEFVKPELQESNPSIETFKNTDNEQNAPEESNTDPSGNTKEDSSTEYDDSLTANEQSDITSDTPEEKSQETHDSTITVNGQKRVDPRFNKKNKNRNRNNNQNDNSQSVAVDAEPVQ